MNTPAPYLLSGLPLVLFCLGVQPVQAQTQPSRSMPETVVTASRLGEGVTGASTTVITAQEIERFPGETLQDVLTAQPGLQSQSFFGGVNGAGTVIDMRGFGAAATPNTLVLINGRRLNDLDLAGIDFSAIPRSSIERIEITRGNGGAVLYGDGAVGGVINIVTRNPFNEKPSLRVDAGFGSHGHAEASATASRAIGDTAFFVNAAAIGSAGYRTNNELRQRTLVAEVRRAIDLGEVYVSLNADTQHLGLPGPRRVSATIDELRNDRRGSHEPFNFADKQGVGLVLGGTRQIADGVEAIVDAGLRRKDQQSAFFSDFGAAFNTYTDTSLTTLSLTPRIVARHRLFGLDAKAIAGVDVYQSLYGSDRMVNEGDVPAHRYDLTQRSLAGYVQETVSLGTATDLSAGLRLQNSAVTARDRYDPAAPSTGSTLPGVALDQDKTNTAFHVGLEHRLASGLAVFGRAGRSFRLPTVDERVGAAPFGVPVDFALRTQTSRDVEAGMRQRWGDLAVQVSAFSMHLRDEIHFDPTTFTNVNLDPTRRRGIETAASHRIGEAVRVRGALTYTEAKFSDGPFKGNDVPLVSRWSGNVGVSWDIVDRLAVLDAVVRRVGDRRFDNDQANFQPQIPGHTAVDMRLGGEVEGVRWSISAYNLLDARYFDYGVASSTTLGRYNAYPLPGRTLIARVGFAF